MKEEVYPAPCGGLVKAPKFLADLVEAIAGAVYIDVDFDVQRVWEVMYFVYLDLVLCLSSMFIRFLDKFADL